MSDRKGWYLKPGTRVSVPGCIFVVVATPRRADSCAIKGAFVREWDHCHASVSYRRRGKWRTMGPVRIGHATELREWLVDHAVSRRTNWVVCPIASEVLTLSRWWEYAERNGVRYETRKRDRVAGVDTRQTTSDIVLTSLVVRGTPDIISYTQHGVSWRWVSGRNYYPDGPPDVLADVRTTITDPAGGTAGAGGPPVRGAVAAAAWTAAVTGLCDWWALHSRTPFGTTIGQLSMGMLRSYVKPRVLCTHNHDDALRIERAGAFGGRASCWYIGSINDRTGSTVSRSNEDLQSGVRRCDGPVTQSDVRSMYPYLMREREYPVKLISYREDMNVKGVSELLCGYGVVARVRVRSQSGEYPVRVGDRVVYPVGSFTTVLCGAELEAAVASGEISTVFAVAIYKLGRPFVEFTDVLISERQIARASGNAAHETTCKLIANALAGKLAQRSGGWERCPPEDMPGQWGESFRINYQTGVIVKHRHIAGVAWRWTADASGRGPHTAAFAYLAAYGRMMMRTIRESLPPRSVVSQDTDGLWTLPSGTSVLATRTTPGGDSPGALRTVGTARTARWWGPRHYCTDGRWTLAGFHDFIVSDTGTSVTERVDTTLWASRVTGAPSQTVHYDRAKSLPLEIGAGTAGPDGWVAPPRADTL